MESSSVVYTAYHSKNISSSIISVLTMLLSVMLSFPFVGEEDDFTILVIEVKKKGNKQNHQQQNNRITHIGPTKLLSRTRLKEICKYLPVFSHYTK